MHAGDISDAVYYSLVEKQLMANGAYDSILYSCRFRDDMLFVMNKSNTFLPLLGKMQALSQCFLLSVEEVSSQELRYLDILIRREEGRLVTFPFLKDPGLSRKLAASSAHAHEVHVAWPRMMLKNIEGLSSTKGGSVEYVRELSKRLKQDGCLLVPSCAKRAFKPLPPYSIIEFLTDTANDISLFS